MDCGRAGCLLAQRRPLAEPAACSTLRCHCFGASVSYSRTEGLDVVAAVASVPVFSPDGRLKAFNELAKVLGDERAAKARATWGKVGV